MEALCYGIGISSFDLIGEVLIIENDCDNYLEYLSECEDKIIVTDIPSPSIVLVLQEAKALITRCGGSTCHAASICREIGKPVIVGVNNIFDVVKPKMKVRIVSSHGRGAIYEA